MPDLAPALTAYIEAVDQSSIIWMLVGSMATHLQGANLIEPGDIDILVHPDTDDGALLALAERLCQAAPPTPLGGSDLATFRSTPGQPLISFGSWTFGRWHVEGGKLEVARIRERLDAGLLENQGRTTWQHRRVVSWREHEVPVVPLEVQWATIIERDQRDRMYAIAARDPVPWDEDVAGRLLTPSLSSG